MLSSRIPYIKSPWRHLRLSFITSVIVQVHLEAPDRLKGFPGEPLPNFGPSHSKGNS